MQHQYVAGASSSTVTAVEAWRGMVTNTTPEVDQQKQQLTTCGSDRCKGSPKNC